MRLIYRYPEQREALAQRFQFHDKLFNRETLQAVWSIFDQISGKRDEAVRELTKQHDQVDIKQLVLSDDYVEQCVALLSPSLRKAIEQAIIHVQEVNEVMLPKSWETQIRPGTVVGEKVCPLQSVGIWIPARKGPLLSTAIMLVTAAKVAGVSQVIVGMPPLPDGLGDPGTVAAARLAGADQFVVGNGIAVIAGFTQGTESIPEVDGIFGPGPGGIAASMSIAMTFGKKSVVGIGPTECMILADESADPRWIAYDLINEAEHGPDSASLLVTSSSQLASEVEQYLQELIAEAEMNRQANLLKVFGPEGKGAIVVVPDILTACHYINDIAPEHLMVVCRPETEEQVISLVHQAGEILLGGYTPFSAANYGIGITAVLPTNTFAKAYSGITVKDMVKYSTIGRLTEEALREIYPIIQELGSYEQLPGHLRAAAVRLD
jgi:histidinol dehydrogenase